jgi:hypothetical protein
MIRLTDPEVLMARLAKPDVDKYNDGFDAVAWLSDRDNVALQEGDSIGIFVYNYPGVYTGHYFFSEHRGKEAKSLAIKMLSEMNKTHGAKLIRGITELDNRPARWMTRQLGFKSYGLIEDHGRKCELFMKNFNEDAD